MNHTILFTSGKGVAEITINRPELSNAFAPETYQEIKEAIEYCDQNPDIRVVRITGSGKHFSAGGDIKRFSKLFEEGKYLSRENVLRAGHMVDAIRKCGKPVVAVINGAAAGAGAGLALACDFRVMAESSKIAASFINMGFSGDTGTMYFLKHMLGTAKTIELMIMGKTVCGKDAYAMGLANILSADDQLTQEADRLVAELQSRPTYAIRRQKELMYEFFFQDFLAFVEREADYMCDTGKTDDHREAVNAFMEKRKPVFKGL